MYEGTRYRGYVYINPSKMKVVRSSYSEGGISVDNVYYDNVIHICVYQGRRMLYGKDVTKKMFADVFPEEVLSQMILADMEFMGVNGEGYLYRAVLRVPESSVSSLVDITIGFDNRMNIKKRSNPPLSFYSCFAGREDCLPSLRLLPLRAFLPFPLPPPFLRPPLL